MRWSGGCGLNILYVGRSRSRFKEGNPKLSFQIKLMGGKSDTLDLLRRVGFVKCAGCSKSRTLIEALDWFFTKPRGKF